MVGSASLLALWILSATTSAQTSSDRQYDEGVVSVAFRQAADEDKDKEKAKTPAAPPRLPPDPAYDAKPTAPLPAAGEGIPGLPPLPPPDVPYEKERKPSKTPPARQLPVEKLPVEKPQPPRAPAEKLPAKPKELAPDRPPSREIPPPPSEPSPRPGNAGEIICTDDGLYQPEREIHEPCRVYCDTTEERCGFFGWLDGFNVDAWLDQGFTINTLSPRNRINGPVTFNNRSNEYQLNQMYLRLGREVRRDCDRWDIGGQVDLLYGTDSIYTSARGLELTDDLDSRWNAQQYGLAMPQLYAELFCPWGNGLSMKLGHFYSPLGYESVASVNNFFYSHSYLFQYAEPHTFTGFLGSTNLGDFTIEAGMTRGDDNWDDNNNDLGVTGGIRWKSCNRRTDIALTVDAAREQDDPSSNVRTIFSLVIQQQLWECWQYVGQYDYGNEPGAGVASRVGGPATSAAWYGLNQYLFRTINERWKAGMRFEWFRDEGGSRVHGADRTADYFELTAGMNWTPNNHLTLRPELRWDWTGTPDYYPFGDGTRSNQVLLGCDLILRF